MAIPVPSLFCKCKVARLFQNISALPVNIFAPLSYPRHFATLRLTCQQIAILAILPLLAGCSKMDPLWRIFPPPANRLLAHIWLAQHTNHPTITTHPLPSFFLLRSLISWVTRSCLFQRPSCNAHYGWPPSWHPVTWHLHSLLFTVCSSSLNWVIIESVSWYSSWAKWSLQW